MNLKSIITITALALAASSIQATPVGILTNEAGTLTFALHVNDAGKLSYTIDSIDGVGNAVAVIEASALGLIRDDEPLTQGFTFLNPSKPVTIDEHYSMLVGKQLDIHNRALEQSWDFAHTSGAKLRITARAMDDSIAFRYAFPESTGAAHKLTGEVTEFDLPTPGVAWMLPYDAIAEWSPSYEAAWENKIAIGTPSAAKYRGWCYPALFHVNNRWILITEAGMDGTAFGTHLQPEAPEGRYQVRLPEVEETYGVAPQEASITLPWASPWRIIVVGSTPAAILETTVVTDLSAPCELEDTSWIQPGRVSWSWWSDKGSPRDYNRLVPFIDLSSDFGWEYSLIDLGWEDMQNGDIHQLLDYANTKDVGLILWYNSGGPHNQVYAGLRDIMDNPERRRAEMAKLQKWGVKGIKVDFMQSDKQYVMQLYIDILRDAADHKLFVDFHGSTVPRGWERTFPNLLTSEGIRGVEQYWDPEFAENAHTFHTIYPLTRNTVGPMDYTPVIFGAAPELQRNLTTHAHELALSVAFESGLQHFVDSVSAYRSQPEFVQDFLKAVPAVWDETRYLGGLPGELSLTARRSGSIWYVACLNGEAVDKQVSVPLHVLGKGSYTANIIEEGWTARSFDQRLETVTATDVLTLPVKGRSGFVIQIKAH